MVINGVEIWQFNPKYSTYGLHGSYLPVQTRRRIQRRLRALVRQVGGQRGTTDHDWSWFLNNEASRLVRLAYEARLVRLRRRFPGPFSR